MRVCEAVVAGLSAGRKPAGSVKRSARRVRSSSSLEGGEDMAIGVAVCFFLSLFFFFLMGKWMVGWWGCRGLVGLGCGAASKGSEVAEWS